MNTEPMSAAEVLAVMLMMREDAHSYDEADAAIATVAAMAEREAALVKEVQALRAAYHKARNAAAGFSNYCPDSANSRRCERDLDEAERMFRAIDAARAEARDDK